MPNTKQAEKALRQSKKRQQENLMWKAKIKEASKAVKTPGATPDILKEQYSNLQSVLDKAAKNHSIHRNKAARLKSRSMKSANATTSKPTKSVSKRKPKSN